MDYLILFFIGFFLGGLHYVSFKAVYSSKILIALSVVFGLLGFVLFSSIISSKIIFDNLHNTYATEMFLFCLMLLIFAVGSQLKSRK